MVGLDLVEQKKCAVSILDLVAMSRFKNNATRYALARGTGKDTRYVPLSVMQYDRIGLIG